MSNFTPKRAASWWCSLEDILWPEKKIIEKIQKRAYEFAKADIDTAINFGFHIRFDFSNYFSQLHGYYATVCDELHKNGIRFIDHYSCNHVQRPKNNDEFFKVHKNHRHHILLFHDPIAAQHAQYEGHFFKDICEVDIRDNSRGYSNAYQLDVFCHNNPNFIDMHTKYLKRLLNDVPMDAIEVDDMCDYAGLTTCGCKYCRDKFQKEYNHEIPSFEDKSFWGVTDGKDTLSWGNYENPIFRDWLRMKSDSVNDHLKTIKETIGNLPLMTCCSSSGPIRLNALALNLEKMSPTLDFFMLENCGISVNSVNWTNMDAEALLQKDISTQMNNAPAIAISYSIYDDSAYLGWALSRFWGVGNWASTLNQRLEKDPDDAQEIQDMIGKYNHWELNNSKLDYSNGTDNVDVRLVSNKFCRENGWRDNNGFEQWDKIKIWTLEMIKNNIGYRFVRADELADKEALMASDTPLIIDGLGCVSMNQFTAITAYIEGGGPTWLSLPFGTHDENGFKYTTPLSELIPKRTYQNLKIIDSSTETCSIEDIPNNNSFLPSVQLVEGNPQWAVRIRRYADKNVLHIINSNLEGIPHESLINRDGASVLKKIKFDNSNSIITLRLDKKFSFHNPVLLSPEIDNINRSVHIKSFNDGYYDLQVDLSEIGIYAVVQEL